MTLGDFRVEFIKTNHSIAGASSLAIYTPAGVIVHTGDFKVDYTPLFGESIDSAENGCIGQKRRAGCFERQYQRHASRLYPFGDKGGQNL